MIKEKEEQLRKSFVEYVKLCENFFSYNKCFITSILPVPLPWNNLYLILSQCFNPLNVLLPRVEGGYEFKKLVSDFSVAFGGKPVENLDKKYLPQQEMMKNFLRRSGFYIELLCNGNLDANDYFEKLCSACGKKKVKIIKLHLLESIYFWEQKEPIDFGDFVIQKFSFYELEELTNNRLNRIFYPNAVLATEELANYWFVKEEIYEERKELDFSKIESPETDPGGLINPPDVVPEIPQPIRLLTLFKWQREFLQTEQKRPLHWSRFLNPISLVITDDLLEIPRPAPSVSALQKFPKIDLSTGREVDRAPFYYTIKKDDIPKIREIVDGYKKFSEIDLDKCGWKFVERAFDYLGKAFFASELDELLWHMVALEALFGEDKSKIRELIQNRLSKIFEEKYIKIDECYKVRNKLVHGGGIKGEADQTILSMARHVARRSVLWFFSFLSYLHSELSKHSIPFEKYPDRKKLLRIIDYQLKDVEVEGKRIELPESFPKLPIWGE